MCIEEELEESLKREKKLEEELDKHKKAIDEIYDTTGEGWIIEVIDVLRGDAVWDEDGVVDYDLKKGGE